MALSRILLISSMLLVCVTGWSRNNREDVTFENMQALLEDFDLETLRKEPEYIQYLYFAIPRDVLLYHEMNGGTVAEDGFEIAPHAFAILQPLLISEPAYAARKQRKKARKPVCTKNKSDVMLCGGHTWAKGTDHCDAETAKKKGMQCDVKAANGGKSDTKGVKCNPDFFCTGRAYSTNLTRPDVGICVPLNGKETHNCVLEYTKTMKVSLNGFQAKSASPAERCQQILVDGAVSIQRGTKGTQRDDAAWYNFMSDRKAITSADKRLEGLCKKVEERFTNKAGRKGEVDCSKLPDFAESMPKYEKTDAKTGYKDVEVAPAKQACANIPAPPEDKCGISSSSADPTSKLKTALSVCQCSDYSGCTGFTDLIILHADRRGIDLTKVEEMQPPRAESAHQ